MRVDKLNVCFSIAAGYSEVHLLMKSDQQVFVSGLGHVLRFQSTIAKSSSLPVVGSLPCLELPYNDRPRDGNRFRLEI